MEAGRELDSLVAEKAMGFRVERITPAWYGREVTLYFQPGCPLVLYSHDDRGCNAVMYRNGVDGRDGAAPPLPSYSSDSGAARDVLDFLHLEWRWLLTNDTPDDRWQMRLRHRTDDRVVEVEADTDAVAICLAALVAVGHPIEGPTPANQG